MEHYRLETDRSKRKRPGRPRSLEAQEAILDATLGLIREVGYDALAVDGVASRAKVGKATIYRYWKTKEALVTEAIGRVVRSIPIPDTGNTEADLLILMEKAVNLYADPATRGFLVGIAEAMVRSESISRAVRSGFVATWQEALYTVLARGISRGDLPPETDLDLAIDLLRGPLFYRCLISDAPIDASLARGVVRVVLCGMNQFRG